MTVIAAESIPRVLSGPATVRVNISISNTSGSSAPVSVTLRDPDKNVCADFGNEGMVSLSQGETVSYGGNWAVSQKELDAGRIIYYADFRFQDEAGNAAAGSRPIVVAIQKIDTVADLDIQRVPPTPMDGMVVRGQMVVLQYQLKNIGEVELTDITITDPGIFSGKVSIPQLQPGEIQELSYSYVAGASTKTSEAAIAFTYQDGESIKSRSLPSMPFAMNVMEPDIAVTVEADASAVAPGSIVDLTFTISNQGDRKYEGLKVSDAFWGEIASGITLDGGEAHTSTRKLTIHETVTFQATVTGESSAGPVTVTSDPVTVQVNASGGVWDTLKSRFPSLLREVLDSIFTRLEQRHPFQSYGGSGQAACCCQCKAQDF